GRAVPAGLRRRALYRQPVVQPQQRPGLPHPRPRLHRADRHRLLPGCLTQHAVTAALAREARAASMPGMVDPARFEAPLPPDVDMVVARAAAAVLVSPAGEFAELADAALAARLEAAPVLTCHARALARRAGLSWVRAFDVLELFA